MNQNEWVQFVTSIMDKINNYNFVSFTLNFIKGAAIILVIIQLLTKYFKAKNASEIFVPKDLIRPIILIAVLSSYNHLMDGAEAVIAAGEREINQGVTVEGDIKATLNQNIDSEQEETDKDYDYVSPGSDQYPEDYIASNTSQLVQLLKHPSSIFIKLFQYIGDFLGTLVYVSCLLIRAFMLFALKILGPIAIVLSIYGKWHNAIWNWLRIYAVYFFWIIPMYIAQTFCDFVYNESYMGHAYGTYSVSTVIGIVLLIVKITIMKGSLDLLKQIFVQSVEKE